MPQIKEIKIYLWNFFLLRHKNTLESLYNNNIQRKICYFDLKSESLGLSTVVSVQLKIFYNFEIQRFHNIYNMNQVSVLAQNY